MLDFKTYPLPYHLYNHAQQPCLLLWIVVIIKRDNMHIMSGIAEVNIFTRPAEIHWAVYSVSDTVLGTRDVAANKTHKKSLLSRSPHSAFSPINGKQTK